jgi:AcrR family transcriptional regulator
MNNADAPQERTGSAQDGRRLRSERSRARILDAVAEALADPDVDLTPAGIAARAGVSVSTIARHFGDREGLVAAMRDRIQTLLLPILSEGPFEGELRARIRELLRRRTAMFEIVAPLYRSALRQARPPSTVRREREQMEELLRTQLAQALAPELAVAPHREPLLAALLSFASWSHMRTEQAIDAERTAALLEQGALALLESRCE